MALTAIIDSSSAILLFKAGIFARLLEIYNLVMSESVFSELTCPGHPGAREFPQYREEGRFTIHGIAGDAHSLDPPPVLGIGEHDTIGLYLEGKGNFIIMDDGRGVGLCIARSIPYINALLVPRVLFFSGAMSEEEMTGAAKTIISIGRYSRAIIDYARGCTRQDLANFMERGVRP